jgi:hypothetical protein
MRVQDIVQARTQRTADRRLDLDDAKAVIAAAGKSVSSLEVEEIARSLVPKGQYEVTTDARKLIRSEVKTLKALQKQAELQNAEVKKRASALAAEEKKILTEGASTKTLGGTPVPEKVKAVVNAMLANGAAAFDVAELSPNPERDEHDPTQWTLTGNWSPYPQEIEATRNMAFSYTEITPKKLDDDMTVERKQTVLVGYDHKSEVDRRTGKTVTWDEPRDEKKLMKGSGDITAHYDECDHPEPEARGTANQKWANNYAILADGSLHALPAMRRTPDQPGLILTNPSLARGKRLLFNGHIEVRGGVMTSIGMSGRLQKIAADGDAKFINPVPLLEAWGFKMAPGLKVTFEGSGDVKVDPSTNLIVKG